MLVRMYVYTRILFLFRPVRRLLKRWGGEGGKKGGGANLKKILILRQKLGV